MLQLGSSQLDADSLSQNQEIIRQWGVALSEQGDILLYGCNVAEDQTGILFVENLSRVIGADVAASVDETGRKNREETRDLEYQTGPVESLPDSHGTTLQSYDYLLKNILGTDGEDELPEMPCRMIP